jgi:hypothetical protein
MLLTENFQLKREMAHDKKRYMDLMNAFLELRNSTKVSAAAARHSLSPTGAVAASGGFSRA